MKATHPIAAENLTLINQLAPNDLKVIREDRYDGSGFDALLSDFPPAAIEILQRIYRTAKTTWELWRYMQEAPNHELMRRHLVEDYHQAKLAASSHRIKELLNGQPGNHTLRKVLHDVLGGALMGLNGYASLLASTKHMGEAQREWVESAALMARDHTKLMRNALPDIDPLTREADEGLKVHFIDDFVRKWSGALLQEHDTHARITVGCDFEGSVTNRCLETSAIDRVLYNFLNNATRFTSDEEISLTITQVNPELVRWVISNRTKAEHGAWLRAEVGAELKALFAGGISVGGQGLGLTNCADFVAASCGVTTKAAIDEGYLGARLIDETYHAWFHWPAYLDTDPSIPRCKCAN